MIRVSSPHVKGRESFIKCTIASRTWPPPHPPVMASLARRSHVVYLYIQSICRNRFSPQASCCVSSLRKWCRVTTYRRSLATQDKHPFSPAHGDIWNYWFRASWDTGPGTRLSRKKKIMFGFLVFFALFLNLFCDQHISASSCSMSSNLTSLLDCGSLVLFSFLSETASCTACSLNTHTHAHTNITNVSKICSIVCPRAESTTKGKRGQTEWRMSKCCFSKSCPQCQSQKEQHSLCWATWFLWYCLVVY